MKKLNLIQGSKEWLETRESHFCASDAPAMMGVSKFMSRTKLMEKFKGIKEEISPALQAIFDKGHQAEDKARQLLSIERLLTFDACVFSLELDGLPLLASLDGLDVTGEIIFEHKLYNKTLAENVINQVLEPSYYWQLEHQMLVCGGKEVLFMTSDGGRDNREAMTYRSVPERREQLIAGWKQFQKDLEEFELVAKVEAVKAEAVALPALTVNVTGSEINTNITLCLEQAKELAEIEMSRELETDQDFANKDQLNKDVKKAREALKAKIQEVRGEFLSYAQFEEIANEFDSVLQKLHSDGTKKVKAAKDQKKLDIKNRGESELVKFCSSIVSQVSGAYNISIIRPVIMNEFEKRDFESAMKNKRTIESLNSAIDDHIADVKLKIEECLGDAIENFCYLDEQKITEKYHGLFLDMKEIITLKSELFKDVVDSRIKKQLEEEKAERERIAKEAADKATREAEEKAQREADAKAEEAREKIRQEEADKLQQEAKNKRDLEVAKEVVDVIAPKKTEDARQEAQSSAVDNAVSDILPSAKEEELCAGCKLCPDCNLLWDEIAEFADRCNLSFDDSMALELILKKYI